MGCAITFPSQNPFLSDSERQVLKAIRTCEIQTLAHYLTQYLELMSSRLYFAKITQLYKKLKFTEETYLKNNNEGNRKEQRIFNNRSHHINYHMDQVLKNIKLADDLLEHLKSQREIAEKKLQEKKIDWNFTIGRIIENSNKKKMISEIEVDNKNMLKEKKMKEEQIAEKIIQCKEKIQQTLSELDVNEEQRTHVVMTQVNKLQDLIKKYKEQIDKLNQEIKNLNIKIKEINQSSNLIMEDKQKKYNRIQKLLDQTKQENNNLAKENTHLKQENEKMKSQLMMQKQSLITEARMTQINIPHLNHVNLDNQKKSEEKKEPSSEQFSKNNSKAQTQAEQSQKKIRTDSNETAKSVQFNKFYQSVIIYKGFRVSKKYKNIIDEIFAPLKIENTIPMFLYDKVRPNNMNQYIKKEENLLILAQLKNGNIIGGFSRFGFKESTQKLKENICFIFYIHSQKQYHKLQLKQHSMAKYSAKLDQNYLKIGENEIRITCGKNEGFSSVGSSSSIFSRKDKKISVGQFLGTNKQSRQGTFELQNYEIFQLSVQYPEQVLKKSKFQFKSTMYEQ